MRTLSFSLPALVLLAACPPTLQKPTSDVSALTLYVEPEPQVINNDREYDSSNSGRAFYDATVRQLVQAGFRVVSDPAKAHSLTARLQLNIQPIPPQQKQMMEGGMICSMLTGTLALDSEGAVVESVAGGPYGGQAPSCSMFVDAVATDLVNGLGASPRIAELANAANPNPRPKPVVKKPEPAAPLEGGPTFLAAAAQPNAYALIIGIEKYRDVPPPAGARQDAERFAQLARTTLGVPEENIRVALDDRAARTDIEKQLEWLKVNVRKGNRVYFYFSGHGAPEPTNGTSYLLPYDGDPQFLDKTAITMASVLRQLGETGAKEVLAVVDSCFSGAGGRSVLPAGTRPLVPVKAAGVAPRVALLSASSGSEISGASSGGGGLLTRYVLEGLGGAAADRDGDGQITLEELHQFVKPRVAREALKENRQQTPSLSVGEGAEAEAFIVSFGYPRK